MTTCPSCSIELARGSAFCPACGARLDTASAETFASGAAAPSEVPAAPRHIRRPNAAVVPVERRFLPGAVIASRYRIIALLGEGGMGQVYRADDLKLGHAVALKFLPSGRSDADAISRLHTEVRLARQISHPNICRIYDIAEVNGEHFLSMEYVDGEDLASLLRRIGRLPHTKAIDIARQICAGLIAAHDNGVLHRDLKPANIMIDGRGRVRITDFGIAGESDAPHTQEVAGTPAYMAPEQLTGAPASTASEIYALGLVIYEVFTGQPAFNARTLLDRIARGTTPPTAPSTVVPDVSPIVERTILRCLAIDPAMRPQTVAAVAAGLPGGDPLAAAVAAGETPSPELVAASGGEGALSPAVAWPLLLGVVACFATIAALADTVSIARMVPLEKSPEVLAERARQVIARAGYGAPAVDTARGLKVDSDYVTFISGRAGANRREVFGSSPAFGIYFWYRQSPLPMIPSSDAQDVTPDDPPHTSAGMVRVVLDGRGQLMKLEAVPQRELPSREGQPVDWAGMFAEAGLPVADFTAVAPTRVPPVFADAHTAWTGAYPGRPDLRLHVEGASLAGRPVYFEITGPWSRGSSFQQTLQPAAFLISGLVLTTIALIIGGVLARRNIRQGRGDTRGALRIATCAFVLLTISTLVGMHHAWSIDEALLIISGLAMNLFWSATLWVAYVALEPSVRRRWPRLITSWARLIGGNWRDPLVGRDILIGLLFSVGIVAVLYVANTIAQQLGWLTPRPLPVIPYLLQGSREQVAALLTTIPGGMIYGLTNLLLLLLFAIALRRFWLAVVALAAFQCVVALFGAADFVNPVGAVAGAVLSTIPLVRFGLLAAVASRCFFVMTLHAPITFDVSVWYASFGLTLFVVYVALATFGFYTSLAGRPVFGRALMDD